MHLIYALVDPRNGERFYVGQSSVGLERPRQHWRAYALREKTAKADYVRALLAFGHVPQIEILQNISDPDESVPPPLHCWTGDDICALDAAEMRWIQHGRDAGWPLTNRTHGGDGLRGFPRTAEHNAKIGVSRIGNQYAKGHVPTEEHRAKISAALKAYTRTPEHNAKIGRGNRGKPKHTEEHKQALRERWSGDENPSRGKKLSAEQRAKMSAAHVGLFSGEKNPNYGKAMSDEQKAKISATKRAQRRKVSAETRAKLSAVNAGINHPMYGKCHSEESRRLIGETKRRRLEVGRWLAYTLAGVK